MADANNEKIINEIKEYVRSDNIQKYSPGLEIIREGQTAEYDFIEFQYEGQQFGMTIENNYLVKVLFYFYGEIPDDMQGYWAGEYRLPLRADNHNHIVGIHKLSSLIGKEELKFMMYRYFDTFNKFFLDIKAVCRMLRGLKHYEYIKQMEDKHARKLTH